MTATVMVYKKCNTDPTEEQLEYVGETQIGSNNSYSFEFIPRETPSSETGDFIVALGIEGADRLVNVDVIEADKPSYTVIPLNIDIKPGVNVISFEDVCINNIDYVKSKEISCKLLVWLSGEEVVTPISDFVLIDIK